MIAGLALAAAAAFNLSCSGESYYYKQLLGPKEGVTPYHTTIRIDPDRRRWCHDECESTLDMVEVSDRYLVFIKEVRGTLDDTDFIVSRETGRLFRRTRLGEFVSISEAQCERAPFTGFPARRF